PDEQGNQGSHFPPLSLPPRPKARRLRLDARGLAKSQRVLFAGADSAPTTPADLAGVNSRPSIFAPPARPNRPANPLFARAAIDYNRSQFQGRNTWHSWHR